MQRGIEYVEISPLGVVQSGFLFAADDGRQVEVHAGSKICLHLGQGHIHQIFKSESDLILVLSDGSRLTLVGFRDADAELFISSNGTLHAIRLPVSGAEDGAPLAFYEFPIDPQQLEDPYGALVFFGDGEVIETATGSVGLLFASQQLLPVGLAGVGLGGALAGGGDGLDQDRDTSYSTPPVLQIDNILGEAEVSGRALPDADVLVLLNGQTLTARADADGIWSVVFSGDLLPPDGTYQATVFVLAPGGQVYESQSNSDVIDFAAPTVTILAGAASVGDIENAADYVDGITIRGTGEPFSTIDVTIAEETASTVVAADGSWQVTFPPGQLPSGEYSQTITLTATDALGRFTTVVDRLDVDTMTPDIALREPAAAVNIAAAVQGVRLAGTAEPGAEVLVEIEGGAFATTQVSPQGDWSVSFTRDQLPRLSGNIDYKVRAFDAAGNTAALDGSLEVDLVPPEAPDIIAYLRDSSSLLGIRVGAGESAFDLATIDPAGQISGIGFDVRYNDTGGFFSYDFDRAVPNGDYLIVTDHDDVGNTNSTLLIVDSEAPVMVDLEREGLEGFDIGIIDLRLAPQATLILDAERILDLAGTGDPLLVRGGADDQVALTGAEDTGQSTVIGGQSYSIYILGDDAAEVWIDDTIPGVHI